MSNNVNTFLDDAFFTEKLAHLKSAYSSADCNIIIGQVGTFSHDKINLVAASIESTLEHSGETKKITKKIFNIAIEILQNISLHGEKDENGIKTAYFIIVKTPNEYNIHAGNIIKTTDVFELNTKLNKLKSLDLTELKKEYISILTNGKLSQKGGAGLGFLIIAIKSENKINFEFENITKNNSLFLVHSKIIIN